MSESTQSSSTFSLPLIVFFIFLGLKLSGGIAWSWWWVTAPLWIGGGITAIFFVISLLFLGGIAMFLRK